MHNYYVLLNPKNEALLFIPGASPDVLDYQKQGFIIQYEGSKSKCKNWINDFWDENSVPDEARLLLTHKN